MRIAKFLKWEEDFIFNFITSFINRETKALDSFKDALNFRRSFHLGLISGEDTYLIRFALEGVCIQDNAAKGVDCKISGLK